MLYLVHLGEIALKGKNRKYFIKTLLNNMRKALAPWEVEVVSQYDRILVYLSKEEDSLAVRNTLQRIFGIVAISPAETAPLSLDAIQEKSLELITKESKPPFTFKVEARRPNKQFSLTSPEINREVGAYLLRHTEQASVDVHSPQLELKIEIRHQESFLYLISYPGPGGLPVGVSGKGILMLSGGIDSPVAGWTCLKRGMELEGIHFHSYPFTSERSKEKVKELAGILSTYSQTFHLHVVPFTEIQKAIHQNCPRDLSITIMRRMMFRLAYSLAQELKAGALVTGECLGQVSSQTLENITAVSEMVGIPVFRPLIGMDKQEIIRLSDRIGTYPISIQPYEDCCTVFLPQNPVTRPSLKQIAKHENRFEWKSLLEECLEQREVFTQTPHTLDNGGDTPFLPSGPEA